ncbi:MAG: NAD-dependent succinate-semialdehyde dehydrogenase [Nitriliruptoraceae bacterium]
MFRSVNPASEAVIATYTVHDEAEVGVRLDAAQRAYEQWRATPLDHRTEVISAFGAALEARVDELASLITAEMGKPLAEAEAEVRKCALTAQHYADHSSEYLAMDVIPTEATESYVRYDPVGVVLAIMPWNFPFWQVVRFAVPIVAAGNAVLVKHAPTTMGCGEAIRQVALDAGMPEGLLDTLRVEPEAAAEVMADSRIRGVTFTGSTRGGRQVASAAAVHGKPTVLELGGSDPFIVLDDADVGKAAEAAMASRLLNGGQSCVSAKRFIVDQRIANDFIDAAADAINKRVVGDPMDKATNIGPMARADIRDNLVKQVKASTAEGATVVIEGGPLRDQPGFFYAPTLLTGTTPSHSVCSDETFGPVAAVMVVDGDDEALRVANATEYGLAAAVWTGDTGRARQFEIGLDVGVVAINDMVKSDPRLPFGGVKASGYGRELSYHGMREFTNAKSVWRMAHPQ